MKKKRFKRTKMFRAIEMAVPALCVALVLFCAVNAALERDAWINNPGNNGVLYHLHTADYLKGTDRISGYAGVTDHYEIPSFPLNKVGSHYLAIWLVHSYCEIRIDDVTVYACREPKERHFGHSPGAYWALVPLGGAWSGNISIDVTPAYTGVRGFTPMIFISDVNNIIKQRLKGEKSLLTISLFCFLEGLLFSIFTIIMRVRGREGKALFYMGLMIADIGLWKLTDMPVIYLLFPSLDLMLTYISLLALMLMVPFTAGFLAWSEEKISIYAVICEVYTVFDIVLLVLHVSGVSDLRENLALVLIAFVLSMAVILEKSILNIGRRLNDWQAWAFIAIAVAGIVDFVIYYYVETSLHLGIALTLVFFYGLTNGILVLRRVRIQRELLKRREYELKESRLALMMSQIRPHFLYNTLNTIAALCISNGSAAREMIMDLSGYLRLNFENMDSIVPVSFKDELAHTKFYLSIEQKRFGDDLKVVYDIGTTDFEMPALSLQPVAENAVKHGIRKYKGSGTLTIRTWEENDSYCISVRDDGGGFDVGAWEAAILYEEVDETELYHRRHVGLSNVRDRIRDMCGGTMEIESKIGEGTEVLITFPKHKKSKDKEEAAHEHTDRR